MSRRREFDQGHQLQMFMTPAEIIENVHKNDTSLHRRGATPREQWEHPQSGVDYQNTAIDRSLRDEKLGKLDQNVHTKKDFDRPWDTAPPLEIRQGPKGMTLTEGHHRLAHAERKGIPYMAVTHRGSD